MTNISYTLPEASDANLSVYDVTGKKVLELLNDHSSKGTHLISADVSALKAGVYYYRLEAGSMSASKRMVIVE
jgi:hypothetical protein